VQGCRSGWKKPLDAVANEPAGVAQKHAPKGA
jgi:hypothetical protein